MSLDDGTDVLAPLPGGAWQYASEFMKEALAKTPETERENEAETQRYLLWQMDQDPRIAPNAWSAAVPKKHRAKRNSLEELKSKTR